MFTSFSMAGEKSWLRAEALVGVGQYEVRFHGVWNERGWLPLQGEDTVKIQLV